MGIPKRSEGSNKVEVRPKFVGNVHTCKMLNAVLLLIVVQVLQCSSLRTSGPLRWLHRTQLNVDPKGNSENGMDTTNMKYCEDVTRTVRRPTRTVTVGTVSIGSEFPIAKQTMTTTVTRDVDASVEQVKKVAAAGADLVRLTVQGRYEADACAEIRAKLNKQGCNTPLVADIHFAPAVALRVADVLEKVRINPGNFADGKKSFESKVYDTKEEYEADLVEIENLLLPLINKCKEKNRAMRIGTNHGSLSARVMSYWGDSPRGMVESALEFAHIMRKHDFHNFVFSMKASNPLVMVQAYRLLTAEMYNRGWNYPLHLGVTEAGEGEDGRMKSSIGIGALLADGLGDTIRVSLTEDPDLELVPCQKLVDIATELQNPTKYVPIPAWKETKRDILDLTRRRGNLPAQLPGDAVDVRPILHRDGSVLATITTADLRRPDKLFAALGLRMMFDMPAKDIDTVDSVYLADIPPESDIQARKVIKRLQEANVGIIAPIDQLQQHPLPNAIAALPLSALEQNLPKLPEGAIRFAITMTGLENEYLYSVLTYMTALSSRIAMCLLEVPPHASRVHASRRAFELLSRAGCSLPVIHSARLPAEQCATVEDLVLRVGAEVGALLVDGLGDGVMLAADGHDLSVLRRAAFALLQGVRMRKVKTDFVSCPSCGRTLFDLQEVTEQIKKRTGHLPGVSVAIMGCIVNGPGEMADADFGYVGGAPGKVDLYVGKQVVRRGIPNELACDELVALIKEHGRWVEPRTQQKTEADTVSTGVATVR